MLGLTIGLINGILVTVLEVPAFIATLTMLFIGRGVILGLTGGKNIAFEIKAGDDQRIFRPRRNQRVRLQQSDPALPGHRRGRRGDAGAHLDRLDDLRHRRKRAGGALRRHQHAPGSHALLCSVLAVRGDRRVDERRAEQGRGPAIRARRRIDRHRVGDRRRRRDFRRARAGHRLLPRRDSDRPDRQGAARRRADHAHHRCRRREDGSGGRSAVAARRGAGLSRRRADHRRADRAVAGAPARAGAFLGLAARSAAAADPRAGRRRHRGRADARHGCAGAGDRQARARRLLLPPRRGGGDVDDRAVAVRPVGAAGLLGRARQHLLDPARVFRDRAAGGRAHLRDGQRRHRSLRRFGAGFVRRGRGGGHEGHGLGASRRRCSQASRRACWPARSTAGSPPMSGCPPSSPRSAHSTGRAASVPRSWRARSSMAFPNRST